MAQMPASVGPTGLLTVELALEDGQAPAAVRPPICIVIVNPFVSFLLSRLSECQATKILKLQIKANQKNHSSRTSWPTGFDESSIHNCFSDLTCNMRVLLQKTRQRYVCVDQHCLLHSSTRPASFTLRPHLCVSRSLSALPHWT